MDDSIPKTAPGREYAPRKPPPALEPAALKAAPATLSATLQITRAATGMVETYQIVATLLPDDNEAR